MLVCSEQFGGEVFFSFFLDVGSLKAFQNSFFHIIVSNEFK